jgi:hypothetical protein
MLFLQGPTYCVNPSSQWWKFAASIFGEQRRLEPMSADRRARWNKEIDWLLSVTDHIVEFAPSQQVSEDGTYMEVWSAMRSTSRH